MFFWDGPQWRAYFIYFSRGLKHVGTRGPFISSHQRSWGCPVLLVRAFAATVSGGGRLLQRWQQHPHRLGLVAAHRPSWAARGQTLRGLHWYFPGRCCDVVEQASNWEIKLIAERRLPAALHAVHGEHSETASCIQSSCFLCVAASKYVDNLLYMEYHGRWSRFADVHPTRLNVIPPNGWNPTAAPLEWMKYHTVPQNYCGCTSKPGNMQISSCHFRLLPYVACGLFSYWRRMEGRLWLSPSCRFPM